MLKLIDITPKKWRTIEGIFLNINKDISDINSKFLNYDSENGQLLLMATSYVKRAVMSGLLIQGVINLNELIEIENEFITIQKSTANNQIFQHQALNLAVELLLSYDSRLTEYNTRKLIIFTSSFLQDEDSYNSYVLATAYIDAETILTEIVN